MFKPIYFGNVPCLHHGFVYNKQKYLIYIYSQNNVFLINYGIILLFYLLTVYEVMHKVFNFQMSNVEQNKFDYNIM